MITPDDIVTKVARAYLPFLCSWIRGEPFAPLAIPTGAAPADFRALERAVTSLLAGSKERQGFGYTVELQTKATRAHGTQSLPVRVHVTSAEDLLYLAGKTEEFAAFVEDVELIRATLPELEPWIAANPRHIIEQHGAWPELLRVCAYFQVHPRPNLYIRELPITVHTKFIEQHTGILTRLLDALLSPGAIETSEKQFERRYGLRCETPLVRLRLLDPLLQIRLGLPLMDVAAPVAQLAALPCAGLRCLVVENKMVFLTLPPLPNTLAIFGRGFQIQLLHELSWLYQCSIWYWGDLDTQGFQILALLRALFPQAVSLMMDAETLDAFHEFVVPGTPSNIVELPHLTYDEQVLFTRLAHGNLRLEQERISQAYAVRRIQEVITSG